MAYTTIDNPELYFQTKLYTGNDSDNHSITLDGSENMQPDWLWIKQRGDAGYDHSLTDSVRGSTKMLYSDLNRTEDTHSTGVKSFDINGFTLGVDDGTGGAYANLVNYTKNYVAWNWKKTAVSGFDIVTATGTGSAKTISHSLSAVPHWIISKEKTGSVNDWVIYQHKNTAAPQTDKLILNETNATSDDSCWNDTTPTSSVFSVSGASVVNRSSSTYVYYLFSEKKGFSKFGSYVGNGSTDGTFVFTGFRPAWVMHKRTDSSASWFITDNKRLGFNSATINSVSLGNVTLKANDATSEAEGTTNMMDLLSNGFKHRQSGGDGNASGGTYIYMAFAESPFVNSSGVPTNAR